MALNPSVNTTMDGRITAPTAAYPYGSAKDESSPDAADGTPYFKARADDIFGLHQALLRQASIVPSGNADTAISSQYVTALKSIATSDTLIWARTGNTDQIPLNKLGNASVGNADLWAQVGNDDPVPLAKLTNAPQPKAVYWAQKNNNQQIPLNKLGNVPTSVSPTPWYWATLNNSKQIPGNKLNNAPQPSIWSWARSNSEQIPGNRLANAPNNSRGDMRYFGGAVKTKSGRQTVSKPNNGKVRFAVTAGNDNTAQSVVSARSAGSTMITISAGSTDIGVYFDIYRAP